MLFDSSAQKQKFLRSATSERPLLPLSAYRAKNNFRQGILLYKGYYFLRLKME